MMAYHGCLRSIRNQTGTKHCSWFSQEVPWFPTICNGKGAWKAEHWQIHLSINLPFEGQSPANPSSPAKSSPGNCGKIRGWGWVVTKTGLLDVSMAVGMSTTWCNAAVGNRRMTYLCEAIRVWSQSPAVMELVVNNWISPMNAGGWANIPRQKHWSLGATWE